MTIRPEQVGPVAIACIVVLAPFDVAVPADGFGPLFIRPLMIAAAALAFAAHSFSRSRPTRDVTMAACACVAAVWLSTALADDRTASAAASIRLTLIVAVLLAAWVSIRTNADRRLLVFAFGAATIVSSSLGIATHVAGHDLLGTQHLLGAISSSNGVVRLTRPFSQANIAAMFLAPSTAVCIIAAVRLSEPSRERSFLLFAGLSGTVAVALTYSNGGYLALGAGFVCGAIVLRRTGHGSATVPVALTTALLATRLLHPAWRRRTRFELGQSADGRPRPMNRVQMWEQAIDAFSGRPLTGLGAGRFGPWSATATPEGFAAAPHAHSIPFEILATTGLTGSLALLGIVGVVAWRPAKSGQADGALLAGVAAIAVHAVVDYGLIFASSGLMIAVVTGSFAASAGGGPGRET